MLEERKTIDWRYDCQFCGTQTIERDRNFIGRRPVDSETDQHVFKTRMCQKCAVGTERRGMRIKYLAWERAPADAVYADSMIKRGAIFEIQKVQQEMHARYITLKGFGNHFFNAMLFTPSTFNEEDKLSVKNAKDNAVG